MEDKEAPPRGEVEDIYALEGVEVVKDVDLGGVLWDIGVRELDWEKWLPLMFEAEQMSKDTGMRMAACQNILITKATIVSLNGKEVDWTRPIKGRTGPRLQSWAMKRFMGGQGPK